MMKDIETLKSFQLNADFTDSKDKDVKEIYKDAKRRLVEVKLQNGAVLSKHKAVEPITVLCLSGNGMFRAGFELENQQKLSFGTLIILEGGVEHEVVAEPEIHILVTKFKAE